MVIRKTYDRNEISTLPVPNPDKTYDGKEISVSINDSPWHTFQISFLDDFRFEYERSDSLKELLEWIALEQFFGQRISKQTREDLSVYYGKFNTPEDDDDDDDEPARGKKKKADKPKEKSRRAEEHTYAVTLGGKEPCIPAFRAGDKALIKDAQNSEANEQGTVVRVLTSEEASLREKGPVYIVSFRDGTEKQVTYEELEPPAA